MIQADTIAVPRFATVLGSVLLLQQHVHSLQTTFNGHHSLFRPLTVLLSRVISLIRVYLLELASHCPVNRISIETELPVLVACSSFCKVSLTVFVDFAQSVKLIGQ